MNDSQLLTNFIIIIITFIFAAFFVAAEFALVQARVTALEEMQEKRDKPSPKINRAIKMVTNLTEIVPKNISIDLPIKTLMFVPRRFIISTLLFTHLFGYSILQPMELLECSE